MCVVSHVYNYINIILFSYFVKPTELKKKRLLVVERLKQLNTDPIIEFFGRDDVQETLQSSRSLALSFFFVCCLFFSHYDAG